MPRCAAEAGLAGRGLNAFGQQHRRTSLSTRSLRQKDPFAVFCLWSPGIQGSAQCSIE